MSDSFLDEATIFFTERCLRGEGLCRFEIPARVTAAHLDKHSYFFSLPQGRMQVCLRIFFDLEDEEFARIRYEFPIDPIHIYSNRFLRICLDASVLVPRPELERSKHMDEVEEEWRPAWLAATEGLIIRRRANSDGDTVPARPPKWAELWSGWERMAAYSLGKSRLDVDWDEIPGIDWLP